MQLFTVFDLTQLLIKVANVNLGATLITNAYIVLCSCYFALKLVINFKMP